MSWAALVLMQPGQLQRGLLRQRQGQQELQTDRQPAWLLHLQTCWSEEAGQASSRGSLRSLQTQAWRASRSLEGRERGEVSLMAARLQTSRARRLSTQDSQACPNPPKPPEAGGLAADRKCGHHHRSVGRERRRGEEGASSTPTGRRRAKAKRCRNNNRARSASFYDGARASRHTHGQDWV